MTRGQKWLAAVGALLLAVYWGLVLEITGASPANFLIIRDFARSADLALIPFRDLADVLGTDDLRNICLQIGGNIALFGPLGFLVPACWPGWRSAGRTIALGLGMSLLIEMCQLFNWRATSVDDLLLNTLGAALGFACYWLLARLIPALRAQGSRPQRLPVWIMLAVWAVYIGLECWWICAHWVGW